jgi:hypothetical protein
MKEAYHAQAGKTDEAKAALARLGAAPDTAPRSLIPASSLKKVRGLGRRQKSC